MTVIQSMPTSSSAAAAIVVDCNQGGVGRPSSFVFCSAGGEVIDSIEISDIVSGGWRDGIDEPAIADDGYRVGEVVGGHGRDGRAAPVDSSLCAPRSGPKGWILATAAGALVPVTIVSGAVLTIRRMLAGVEQALLPSSNSTALADMNPLMES